MARGVHVAMLAGAFAIGCSTLVGADFDVTLAAGGSPGTGAGAHGPVASSAASAAGGSTSSGGGAVSSSSTNAGPSSGVGGCGDPTSECNSCIGCVTQSGACQDQENACNDGSGCAQIVDCVTSVSGCMSLSCVNACTLGHKPDAVQGFYQLYSCRCSHCPNCAAGCEFLHCFNGVLDADETETDCSGDNASAGCLLCSGANCIVQDECKSGYCSRQNICG